MPIHCAFPFAKKIFLTFTQTKTFYMKKLLFIFSITLFALSCTNNETKDAKTGDSTKTADTKMAGPAAEKLDLPYTLDHPYAEWQPGNEQHAVTVMKGLKAFETGDIASCMASFGDSVWIGFDYYQHTLSKDSLKAFFTQSRAMYSSIKIKMQDWESVISADKKAEWVTLWYKEYTTDKKGVIDSVSVVNDAKIEKGKVVILDETTQHLGPPPAKK